MDWSGPRLIYCYDMVHCLAGGAIVYTLNPGPAGGEPEDPGAQRDKKVGPPPPKGQ